MSTLTIPAIAGNDSIKAGTVITARTSDTATMVWFYVLAVVSDTHVFGVNVGQNAHTVAPEGNGFRFDTAKAEHYGQADTLTRLSAEVREALASFLVAAGLPAPGEDTPRVSGDQDTDQAYARGLQDGRASANREFEAWKEQATETAHEYADRNDLCSEFDRCMTDIGLRPRTREFLVTLSVSTTVTVSVSGRDEDDAEENARETFGYSPSSYVEWSSVEVEVSDIEEE